MHPEPFPILLGVHIPQIIWAPPSCFCVDSNKICLSNVCCLNEVMCLPGAALKTWAWQKHGVPLYKDFATRTAPVLELYPLSCLAFTATFTVKCYLFGLLAFVYLVDCVWGGTWALGSGWAVLICDSVNVYVCECVVCYSYDLFLTIILSFPFSFDFYGIRHPKNSERGKPFGWCIS